MKLEKRKFVPQTALIFGLVALGGTAGLCQSNSSSANYRLLHAPPGGGGGQLSGGNVVAHVSVGDGIAGGASQVSGSLDLKGGYTGQLYDPVAVRINASPETVGEGATRQLGAHATMDDATALGLDPAELAWTVVSGPIATIGTSGLANAALVYQDTDATVRGSWLSLDGDLTLTVINLDPDNFGLYAGDGIDDDWQVAFFGEDNPDAAPGEDPDFDGDDNLFESLALTDPVDAGSFFRTRLRPTPGQPGKVDVVFSPLAASRNYVVMSAPDPDPTSFVPLAGSTTVDAGVERTVTDNDTSPNRRFYKVEISKP